MADEIVVQPREGVIVDVGPGPVFGPGQAQLNITINGQNGDLPDPVAFDATDADVKAFAQEAVATGYVPGITADERANFNDFVVDRFPATNDRPFNRLVIRPKTPFGDEKNTQVGVFVFGPGQDKNHPWIKEWASRDPKKLRVAVYDTHAELHTTK